MIRVLVVDDEAPARRKLRLLLGDAPDIEVVGEAETGERAVEAIRALQPDVVFLDIQMPEGDGFDVVEAIGPSEMPITVFVTAYDEHAVRAFEVEAIDYILKPYAPERLAATMQRVRARLGSPGDGRPRRAGEETDAADAGPANAASGAALARAMDSLAATRPPLRHLLVTHGNRSLFLPVERIDWVDADRNYLTVHAGGHTFSVRCTLNAFEARLDAARFLRINRSQMVRIDAVREVHDWSHGDRRVVMQDGSTLVWSRRYRARDDGRFGIE